MQQIRQVAWALTVEGRDGFVAVRLRFTQSLYPFFEPDLAKHIDTQSERTRVADGGMAEQSVRRRLKRGVEEGLSALASSAIVICVSPRDSRRIAMSTRPNHCGRELSFGHPSTGISCEAGLPEFMPYLQRKLPAKETHIL
ncbi:hypothetical protein C9I56_33150 [Paraburkholderia caribensis]|nr:hypothetical protein C9I56_33150 [Paraburkholderia caribensis]